jgi:hypothetical protein
MSGARCTDSNSGSEKRRYFLSRYVDKPPAKTPGFHLFYPVKKLSSHASEKALKTGLSPGSDQTKNYREIDIWKITSYRQKEPPTTTALFR